MAGLSATRITIFPIKQDRERTIEIFDPNCRLGGQITFRTKRSDRGTVYLEIDATKIDSDIEIKATPYHKITTDGESHRKSKRCTC